MLTELDVLTAARPDLHSLADETMTPGERTKLINAIVAAPRQPVPDLGNPHPDRVRETGVKTALLRSWEQSGSRRTTRAGVLAACLALVAAVMTVVSTATVGGHRPAASAAADTVLRQAVDALDRASSDPVLPPGHYLLTTEDVTSMLLATDSYSRKVAYLQSQVVRTWQPADPAGTWLQSAEPSRIVQWLLGSPAEARAQGLDLSSPGYRRTARCGDFDAADDRTVPCHSAPGWQNPTRAWLDSLPRDPDTLFNRVKHDAPRFGPGGSEIFTYLVDTLRTGTVPADLRATFYQVIAHLPGLVVTDREATLDGRQGVALGINDGTRTNDIVIDPATGRFIGERSISTTAADGIPAGTLTYVSSVTAQIVNGLGVDD